MVTSFLDHSINRELAHTLEASVGLLHSLLGIREDTLQKSWMGVLLGQAVMGEYPLSLSLTV